MKPLLVLQHTPLESACLIADLWLERGGQVHTLDAVSQPLPAPEAFAGVVSMGGPQSVYEVVGEAWLQAELALMRACLQQGRPLLGVCLGSQVLAHALGARVYRNTAKEVGWGPLHLESAASQDLLFKGLPADFNVLHWHGDTYELPPGAVLLASSELTAHQAFRQGASAWGLQFHVEVRATDLPAWLPVMRQEHPPMRSVSEAELLAPLAGLQRHSRPLLERFLGLCG